MEKYLAGLLLSIFALTANAQSDDMVKIIEGKFECGKSEAAIELLSKFQEQPLIRGITFRADGSYDMLLFTNLETGSWTILENHDGYYCIIASGENIGINGEILKQPGL